MKIWVKLIISILLGIVLGLYVSDAGADTTALVAFASKLFVQAGKYVLFPLVFFSLAMAVFEQRRERQLSKTGGRILLVGAIASFGVILVGTLLVLMFSPARIPIIMVEKTTPISQDAGQLLLQVFPANAFQIFTGSTEFLLPVMLLAFLLGLNFTFNLQITQPVVHFFDSFNRILYSINSLVTEIVPFFFFMIVTQQFIVLKKMKEFPIFSELFFSVFAISLVVVLLVLPVVMYFITGRKVMFRWLYSQFAPALMGLFSGDVLFPAGQMLRNGFEVYGLRRQASGIMHPVTISFFRAGSAMVSAVAFIVILRSYSSAEITLFQVLWISLTSLAVSFMLGAVPGSGAFAALSLLSFFYGKGMEEGFLILRPAIPVLVMIGAMVDVVVASFITAVSSEFLGQRKKTGPKVFI